MCAATEAAAHIFVTSATDEPHGISVGLIINPERHHMTVTVYTKPNCVQCNATKRSLDKIGIEYDTVDITEDDAALQRLIDLGFQAAPVVVVDGGSESWAGYQPDKISALAA